MARKKSTQSASKLCPCAWQANSSIDDCCGRYIFNQLTAPTAEALMRSRYTAFVIENEGYLLRTWHINTRPQELDFEPTQWLGLSIHHTEQLDDTATVSFTARYKINGRAHKLSEHSHFVLQNGHWLYVDGDVTQT